MGSASSADLSSLRVAADEQAAQISEQSTLIEAQNALLVAQAAEKWEDDFTPRVDLEGNPNIFRDPSGKWGFHALSGILSSTSG